MFETQYTGRRFNREQLLLITQVMLCAAVDAVECSLPPDGYTVEEWKTIKDSEQWKGNVGGIVHSLGWQLSIFYAQVTGDGMGVGDALDTVKFEDYINRFIPAVTTYKVRMQGKPHDRIYPKRWRDELDEMAEQFVDRCFDNAPGDYLRTPTEHQDIADVVLAEVEAKTITSYGQMEKRIAELGNAHRLNHKAQKAIYDLCAENEAATMLQEDDKAELLVVCEDVATEQQIAKVSKIVGQKPASVDDIGGNTDVLFHVSYDHGNACREKIGKLAFVKSVMVNPVD